MLHGTLVGVAWLGMPFDDDPSLFIHPHHQDLTDEMIAYAEAWGLANSEEIEVETYCLETDESLLAVLRHRGYEKTDDYDHFKARSLEQPLEEVSLPAGYSIRHAQGKEDVERIMAVHFNVFEHNNRKAKGRWTMMSRSPTYRPELDLVFVASQFGQL